MAKNTSRPYCIVIVTGAELQQNLLFAFPAGICYPFYAAKIIQQVFRVIPCNLSVGLQCKQNILLSRIKKLLLS